MSKKVFKVGDRVKVINKGEICRYYKEFINKNAPKYINKFQDGFSPNNGSVGVVVGVGLNTVYRYPFFSSTF